MSVSGVLEFSTELADNLTFQDVTGSVQSFSMNDGRLEISSVNSSDFSVFLATDLDGNITSLFLFAQSLDFVDGLDQVHEIVTRSGGGSDFDRVLIIVSDVGIEAGRDIAIASPPVGSWTLVSAPVPSIHPIALYTLVPGLLIGIGLLAIRRSARAGPNSVV